MKRWLLVFLAVPAGGLLGGVLGGVAVTLIQHFMGEGNSHNDAVDLFGMVVLGGLAGVVLGPTVAFFMTRTGDK